jgi:hypothetical protein
VLVVLFDPTVRLPSSLSLWPNRVIFDIVG